MIHDANYLSRISRHRTPESVPHPGAESNTYRFSRFQPAYAPPGASIASPHSPCRIGRCSWRSHSATSSQQADYRRLVASRRAEKAVDCQCVGSVRHACLHQEVSLQRAQSPVKHRITHNLEPAHSGPFTALCYTDTACPLRTPALSYALTPVALKIPRTTSSPTTPPGKGTRRNITYYLQRAAKGE